MKVIEFKYDLIDLFFCRIPFIIINLPRILLGCSMFNSYNFAQPNLQSRPLKEGNEMDQFWVLLDGKSEYGSQMIARDVECDPHLFSFIFSKGLIDCFDFQKFHFILIIAPLFVIHSLFYFYNGFILLCLSLYD